MKTKIITVMVLLFGGLACAQHLPKVISGSIQRIENFNSRYIPSRNVDVWLPEGYSEAKKYTVVYMHDGQMLFDSTQTWNKKAWEADKVFSQLINEKKIEECIIVGIWNNGADRISEYFPNKIFNQLDEKTRAELNEKYCNGKEANGDNYLKFLITELKPYIDHHFSTMGGPEHTFMIGSSMGGLISIYAISEYPEVFGGVACISTAWLSQIEPNYAIPIASFEYLKSNMAAPSGHKIYMDYGTGESDKNYEMTQSFVDLIAKGKGYDENNYLSKVYDKAIHDEVAWSLRLNVPVEFLMSKVRPEKTVSGEPKKR